MTSAARATPHSTRTHTVCTTSPGLWSTRAAEEDRSGLGVQQHDDVRMVEKSLQCPMSPILVCRLQTWEPHQREREGERRRDRSTEFFCIFSGIFWVFFGVENSAPFLSIYRTKGVHPSLHSPCGTIPMHVHGAMEQGVAGQPTWAWPMAPPLPFFFSFLKKNQRSTSPNGLLSKRRLVALLN